MFSKFNNTNFIEELKKRGINHPSEYKINKKLSKQKLNLIFEDCIANAFEQVYSKFKVDIIKISYDIEYKLYEKGLFGLRVYSQKKFSDDISLKLNFDRNKVEDFDYLRIIYNFLSIKDLFNEKNNINIYLNNFSNTNSTFPFVITKSIPKEYLLNIKMIKNELFLKKVRIERRGYSNTTFTDFNKLIKSSFEAEKLNINYFNAQIFDDILGIFEDKELNTEFSKLANRLIKNEVFKSNDKIEGEIKKFKDSKNTFFEKFDKNNNGKIDILETKSGFSEFIKKYQKDIIAEDKKYLKDMIKLSNFLIDQEYNLQKTYSLIKGAKTKTKLSKFKKTFEIQHFSYANTLFESYRLVLYLVKGELFSFYDIYDQFERNRIFESQWQRDLHTTTEELKNIRQLTQTNTEILFKISNQIRRMEISMIEGFNMVNQTLEEGFESVNQNIQIMNKSLTNELKGINNKLWWNNLFQVVQIYQNKRRYNQLNKLIRK